jgi:hypothetical protein
MLLDSLRPQRPSMGGPVPAPGDVFPSLTEIKPAIKPLLPSKSHGRAKMFWLPFLRTRLLVVTEPVAASERCGW